MPDRLFTARAFRCSRWVDGRVPPVYLRQPGPPDAWLAGVQAILVDDAIKTLASSPHFGNLRRLSLNSVDATGFKAIGSSTKFPNLNRLMLLCPEGVKVPATVAAKFNNRSAFPNLGQVWFGGSWGKTNLAPLLKAGSVPWLMPNQDVTDEVARKRLETRTDKLGGYQAPLDERFEPTWDGE